MMMTIMLMILAIVMMGTNKERRVPSRPPLSPVSTVPCILHIAFYILTLYTIPSSVPCVLSPCIYTAINIEKCKMYLSEL